ncbi:MAG: transporter substrate-binding domain-containing protein [Roseibium sp.]
MVFHQMPTAQSFASEIIRITTHDLPPYSFRNANGQIDGQVGSIVSCAMDQMDREFEILVVPWKRAQMEVQRGRVDGFFPASVNGVRNSFARMSTAIAYQKWTWYLLKDSNGDPNTQQFRTGRLVSSFLGANMQSWLLANEYSTVDFPPQTNSSLLELLLRKRLDAILVDEQVMDAIAEERDLDGKLRKVVLKTEPLGVYFSERFLNSEPGFFAAFNKAVDICRELGDSEKDDVTNQSGPSIISASCSAPCLVQRALPIR